MSDTTENNVENTEAQAAPEQQPAGAELSVQDLSQIKNIIDVASTRGAFKASEMAAVGITFNKLDAFLNAVAAQQQKAEAEAPAGE